MSIKGLSVLQYDPALWYTLSTMFTHGIPTDALTWKSFSVAKDSVVRIMCAAWKMTHGQYTQTCRFMDHKPSNGIGQLDWIQSLIDQSLLERESRGSLCITLKKPYLTVKETTLRIVHVFGQTMVKRSSILKRQKIDHVNTGHDECFDAAKLQTGIANWPTTCFVPSASNSTS